MVAELGLVEKEGRSTDWWVSMALEILIMASQPRRALVLTQLLWPQAR